MSSSSSPPTVLFPGSAAKTVAVRRKTTKTLHNPNNPWFNVGQNKAETPSTSTTSHHSTTTTHGAIDERAKQPPDNNKLRLPPRSSFSLGTSTVSSTTPWTTTPTNATKHNPSIYKNSSNNYPRTQSSTLPHHDQSVLVYGWGGTCHDVERHLLPILQSFGSIQSYHNPRPGHLVVHYKSRLEHAKAVSHRDIVLEDGTICGVKEVDSSAWRMTATGSSLSTVEITGRGGPLLDPLDDFLFKSPATLRPSHKQYSLCDKILRWFLSMD